MNESGLVVKSYNQWFDVVLPDGRRVSCQPRGRLRREVAHGVLAGDRVTIRLRPDGTGWIEAVEPRHTLLERPPVANVDQVVVVATLHSPELNRSLLDRILVQAEAVGLTAVLVWNKIDLVPAEEQAELHALAARYQEAGYPTVFTSALTGQGVDALAGQLPGKVSVMSGPSGVGKSRLLNALRPGSDLVTGGLSGKLGGGKHTTRHVELLPLLGGGWIADAPGFSRQDLSGIEAAHLSGLFPELAALSPNCRFRGCRHRAEPGCAVHNALAEGRIDRLRYEHYLQFLAEIEDREAHRY